MKNYLEAKYRLRIEFRIKYEVINDKVKDKTNWRYSVNTRSAKSLIS